MNKVANHWSTPVGRDGRLYGMFQLKNYGSGPVKCTHIRTRKVLWSKEGFAPGNVILSGVRLLALSEKGEQVMILAGPGVYKELARGDVLEGKCWAIPTLAADRILSAFDEGAGVTRDGEVRAGR